MDYHDLRTPIARAPFLNSVPETVREALADILASVVEDANASTKDVASDDTGAIVILAGEPGDTAHVYSTRQQVPQHVEGQLLAFSWQELQRLAGPTVGAETPLRYLLTSPLREEPKS